MSNLSNDLTNMKSFMIGGFVALLLTLWGWFPAPALAVDFPVPCSDDGPERLLFRIVEANNTPGPDRIILAADCVYGFNRPADTTGGGNALPTITDDLVIEGNGATLERTSGGQDEFRLLRIENEATVTLKDLTLRNGRLSTPGGQGGGLFAGTGTDLTLINVNFEGNKGTIGGGLRTLGSVKISGGQFVGNQALTGSGGGIFTIAPIQLADVVLRDNVAQTGGGGMAAAGTVQLNGGEFSGNQALTGGGGGLSTTKPTTITGTLFSGNRAESNGGGLAAFDLAQVTINDAHFFDNRSQSGSGGGLYAFTTVTLRNTQVISNAAREFGGGLHTEANATISDAQFEGNKAFGFSSGGGLLVARGLSLTRSTFVGNAAFVGGGAAAGGSLNVSNSRFEANGAFAGGALFAAPDGEDNILVNNVWLNNIAINAEAVIHLQPDSAEDIPVVEMMHNTIVSTTTLEHAAVVANNVNVRLQNSIVGNYGGGFIVEEAGQIDLARNLLFGEPFNSAPPDGDNIIDDPLFADLIGSDLHLQPDSPAKDAGLDAGVTVDFDGNTRPQGEGFDIGAFEFKVETPPPTPTPSPSPTPTPDPTPDPTPSPDGNFTIFLPLVLK